jgi:hypothetical protein
MALGCALYGSQESHPAVCFPVLKFQWVVSELSAIQNTLLLSSRLQKFIRPLFQATPTWHFRNLIIVAHKQLGFVSDLSE